MKKIKPFEERDQYKPHSFPGVRGILSTLHVIENENLREEIRLLVDKYEKSYKDQSILFHHQDKLDASIEVLNDLTTAVNQLIEERNNSK